MTNIENEDQIFQNVAIEMQLTPYTYIDGIFSNIRILFIQNELLDQEKQGCLDDLEKISSYEQDMNYECQICYNVQDAGLKLICDHFFCESCVIQWLKTSRKCPMCQKDLIKKYEEKKNEQKNGQPS